jgi:hypothetical protein
MKVADAILPRYRCVHTGAIAEAVKIGAVMVDRLKGEVTLLPATIEAPHLDLPLAFYHEHQPKTGDYFLRQGGTVTMLNTDVFEGNYTAIPKEPAHVA